MVTRTLQDGFSGGEFSPEMSGNINNPLYPKAAARLENFIPKLQGPASYRPGLRFHINTRKGNEAFFIDFKFSETETYVLEFTSSFLRVHRYDTITGLPIVITDLTGPIDSVTVGVETIINDVGHGISNGDYVFIENCNITKLNGRTFLVSNVLADSYKIKDEITEAFIDTTGEVFAVTGGENWFRIFQEPTPYTSFTTDLRKIKHAQFGNNMFLTVNTVKPQVLERVTDTNWTLSNYTPVADPFVGPNNCPSAVVIYENRLILGGTTASPQQIFGSVAGDFNDHTIGTSATDAFVFSLTSARNNTILWLDANDRFLVAGTLGGALKVYGATEQEAITPTSITTRTLSETNASSVSPATQGGRLVFVEHGKGRMRGLEFERAKDGYESLDLNLLAGHITKGGMQQITVQDSEPDTIWAVRGDGKLIGCTIDFREGIFAWHRHSTEGNYVSIVSMRGTQEREQIWVCVKRTLNGQEVHSIEVESDQVNFPVFDDFFTGKDNLDSDRQLFLGELFEAQKIATHMDSVAFFDGLLGPREINNLGTNDILTLGAVTGLGINVASTGTFIFLTTDVGKEIWGGNGIGRAEIVAFVNSSNVTVNIKSDFLSVTLKTLEWYLTTDDVFGLHHLEGETVSVLTDGSVHADKVVANGRITLDQQASFVQVGLTYKGIIKTLPLETPGLRGPITTKTKNLAKIGIKFINSLGAKYGVNRYRMNFIRWRQTNAILSRPAPLFNGVKELAVNSSWLREREVIITQELPYPCTVQLIVPYVNSSAA